MKTYLGIDIGAGSFNFIRGSRGDAYGKTYVTKEIPSEQDPITGMRKIIEAAKELVQGYKVKRIGCGGTTGNSAYGGMAKRPPTMPRWKGVKVVEQLEGAFQCDVRFENDVDVGTIGEYEFGHRDDNMVWVYIGTGSSAGVIRDGCLLRGFAGEHLEIGHTTLSPKFDMSPKSKEFYQKGAVCNCGQVNDFESVVSGVGIRNVYQKAPEKIEDPKIWEEIGHNLGQVLYNITHYYGPRLIVLGGGVAVGAGEKLIEPARRYLKEMEERESLLLSMPEIKLTKLGEDITLLGTLALAMAEKPY